jgi:hypothetical protein
MLGELASEQSQLVGFSIPLISNNRDLHIIISKLAAFSTSAKLLTILRRQPWAKIIDQPLGNN